MQKYPHQRSGNQKLITSYTMLNNMVSKLRFPQKGKALNHTFRAFKTGDTIQVWICDGPNKSVHLCDLTPDNVLTFVASTLSIRNRAQTIVSSLHTYLPVFFTRFGMGKYRIASYEMVFNEHKSFWDYWNNGGSTTSPQYFAGIQFDMASGACLNRRPDLKHQVVSEVRRQWLKDIAQWRKGIALRSKLGVLDAIALEENFFKRNYSKRLDTLLLCNHIVKAIKEQDFSKDTLDVIVFNLGVAYRSGFSTAHLDNFFKEHSVQLRMAYGVFGEHNKNIFIQT